MRLAPSALALALAVLVAAGPGRAQPAPPATLVANDIRFQGASETVIAEGAVEIFYEGMTLSASRIVYRGSDDTIAVEGPLVLTDATGTTIFLADYGQLSTDMQEGVLRSARLVLDRQLQIAATEITYSEGRYTQAYQTVASSCEVCAENPVPLWEIRARRIVHDSEARMIWFEGAEFRAMGVPIAYFPRLRLPDPTLDRATGVLVPRIFGNDAVGSGVQIPYFVALGDHADLTFSPYYTDEGFGGTGLRYRQAFAAGWVEAEGQLSFDDLTDDTARGYVFADGFFLLPQDFVLDLQVEATSDRAYLVTYGITERDRLESFAIVSRTRRDEYIEAGFTSFYSLRDGESNSEFPNQNADAEYTRRLTPGWIGGIAELTASSHSHYRASDDDIVGRDLSRLSGSAAWRRDWVMPAGVLFALDAEVRADHYWIYQDSAFDDEETRVTSFAAAEVSWPWAAIGPSGARHLIEPTAQLAWSEDNGTEVPNEDSVLVTFDEANLFSLSRHPGSDEVETGTRFALGVGYTRTAPAGWAIGTTVGRVWYDDEDTTGFTSGSGLDGSASDWLWSLHLDSGTGVRLVNRALFDSDFIFTSSELDFAWVGVRHDVASTITYLAADPAEGRDEDAAEWALEADYIFDRGWSGGVNWRYDFEVGEPTRAGLEVGYATECVDVEFSLSRRFTSSSEIEPANEFALTVALIGFGGTRSGREPDRTCYR